MGKSYRYWKDHLESSIREFDRVSHVIETEQMEDYVETSKRYLRNVYCDCVEMLYKSIKFVLVSDGVELKQDSPKAVFREGSRQSFYSNEDADILVKCVDLRNLITHDYDMFERTEKYLIAINNVKDTLDQVSDTIANELSNREEGY